MSLSVDEAAQGRWTVLRIAGELDLMTSPEVRRRVHEAVADGHREIVVDLSDVYFCDSSGVGVLIASRRLLHSCRGALRVVLPESGATEGSHVNRVLAALGVRRLFEVFPDADAAADDEAQPLSA
ncbi:STAS domain-containing protein [Streptomyces montanisoli]|uniref:Anti-sigma factor antagonist n=1 Tax=Streptomyces montanisoli TaxID=2798581 RepID=A0A940MKI8_9ACTN|nr:STAS domain-containing protein [Streptomyces montanisoli]MBP0461026.1 STAS domain-containing protein [Streptomyces montanisoli]